MKSFYAEAFRSRLKPQTLADIAGWDAAVHGFCRPICCGDLPKGLSGSAKITEHFFISTGLQPKEWSPHLENIPSLHPFMQTLPRGVPHPVGCTLFHSDQPSKEGYLHTLLHFLPPRPSEALSGSLTEYSLGEPLGEMSWESIKATAPKRDRSSEYLIFVCAHGLRDARCGYCGPVLVDLFQQAVETMKQGERVHVHACSHVGGHVYAANVLVFSRFGGVFYGLFTPADIEPLLESFCHDTGAIPASLHSRIRGILWPTGGVK
ncbi:unnamed protein product [Phytomonas sp. EM1]|nr:unnamed protein product [Phytomonas sp. EM1]|eukprot:CCW65221.1 unnamed protein product [Phytomonas sp. isolate EM1]